MKSITEKARKIKLLILDVDGVLTDGRIVYDDRGREMKFFNVHDGLGIVLLKKAGIKTAIITAKGSKAVKLRAKDMRVVKVYQNFENKIKAYKRILKRFKVSDEQVCFVGDELIDLPVLRKVGFAVVVNNGVGEIKKFADYVTKKEGGRGAVREVVELILKSQNKWGSLINKLYH